MILTITNSEGKAVVSLSIGEIDPPAATIAILNALAELPKPRAPRSDKGVARKEALMTNPTTDLNQELIARTI